VDALCCSDMLEQDMCYQYTSIKRLGAQAQLHNAQDRDTKGVKDPSLTVAAHY